MTTFVLTAIVVTADHHDTMATGRMSDMDQYCRIFIIGAKDCSHADIREAFESYGQITDVYIPRKKSSHENMGQCSFVGRFR